MPICLYVRWILIFHHWIIFELCPLNRQCSWPDLPADPIRDQPCPGAAGGWPGCPGRWGEAAGGEVHGAVRVPAGGRPGGLWGHPLTGEGHQGVHQQDQLQTCGVSHYNPHPPTSLPLSYWILGMTTTWKSSTFATSNPWQILCSVTNMWRNQRL